MTDQSYGIQPLAALQNLVGGNRTANETDNAANPESSFNNSDEIELQKISNNSSITISKNNNGTASLEHVERKKSSILSACTITRIPAKDTDVPKISSMQRLFCDYPSNTPVEETLNEKQDPVASNRILNRSGSLDGEKSLSKTKTDVSETNKRRARSLSVENNCNSSETTLPLDKINEESPDHKINSSVHDSANKQNEDEQSDLLVTSVKIDHFNNIGDSHTFTTGILESDRNVDKPFQDIEMQLDDHSLDDLVSDETKCQANIVEGTSVSEVPNDKNSEVKLKNHRKSTLYYDESFEWENLKCGICKTYIMKNEPKLMPCLHTLCGKCFQKVISEQKEDDDIIDVSPCMQCTVCRRNFPQSDVIDHVLLLEKGLMQKESPTVDTFTCTSCSDDETAAGFCSDCSEWLCEACIQAHKRVKVTKEHTIKTKDEVSHLSESSNSTSIKQLQFCQSHPKESLNLYCVTCNQLTCRDCQLREHRDHKYKFASEMAAQVKESFKSHSLFIQKKKTYITSAKDLVAERKEQLAKRKESVEADIQRLVDTFTDLIKQRGKTLNKQLSEICKTKEDQLDKKTDVLLHLGNQADYCVSFLDKVLDSSSELAILYSKKVVNDYVLKVDKDSPDINLFNRFRNKLNNGDDISLRISNESRNLGKDLKSVGYLLVENRIYPSPPAEVAPVKPLSSQASPVSDNSSPRPPSQPATMAAAPSVPTPPTAHAQISIATSRHATPPMPVAPPAPPVVPAQSQSQKQMTPAPPTLTPMHNHNHQLMIQGNSQMHQKLRYNQCSPVNPPGLVRIQPKPGMGPNNQCSPQNMNSAQMNHVMPSFQRMPHMTPQNCRPPDMAGVSSTTHPFSETSHLRGLLGSNAYKMGSYPQMMRMPQHNSSPYGQHSVSAAQQLHHQQRILEQNRLVLPLNAQLAMAAVAMAPPLMSNPRAPINSPRTQSPLNPSLRNAHGLNGNCAPKDPARGSPQNVNAGSRSIENGSASPSWHTPQSLMVVASCDLSQGLSTSTVSSTNTMDNSYKIMLGSSKSVSVTPLVQSKASLASEETSSPAVSVTSPLNTFRPIKPREDSEQSYDSSSENVAKSTFSVLNSLIGDITVKESTNNSSANNVSSSPVKSPDVVPSVTVTNSQCETPVKSDAPAKRDPADPNDDWCAVCWDGGDLICCDFCPKVFHMNCHIPTVSHLPRPYEKWQCMICRDLDQIPDETGQECAGDKRKRDTFTPKQLKIAQRILLELYCNYEASQPFRELVDRELTEYYEVIQHPMALEIIKKKLKPDFVSHYTDLQYFVRDVKLIFQNCYEFNPSETEIHQNARILEDFFNQLLAKWLPDHDFSQDLAPAATQPDAKRQKMDS